MIIDYATLTGAVLIALGHECAGLMTPTTTLARELVAAGEATGERLWRLPLWDEYRENLKSEWADMKNTGGRVGRHDQRRRLPEGVRARRACPGRTSTSRAWRTSRRSRRLAAGATGFGVALTIEFLKRRFGV